MYHNLRFDTMEELKSLKRRISSLSVSTAVKKSKSDLTDLEVLDPVVHDLSDNSLPISHPMLIARKDITIDRSPPEPPSLPTPTSIKKEIFPNTFVKKMEPEETNEPTLSSASSLSTTSIPPMPVSDNPIPIPIPKSTFKVPHTPLLPSSFATPSIHKQLVSKATLQNLTKLTKKVTHFKSKFLFKLLKSSPTISLTLCPKPFKDIRPNSIASFETARDLDIPEEKKEEGEYSSALIYCINNGVEHLESHHNIDDIKKIFEQIIESEVE